MLNVPKITVSDAMDPIVTKQTEKENTRYYTQYSVKMNWLLFS